MPDNLALRMRPKTIDQVIGQDHLVGSGKIIRRMVEAKSSVLHDSLRTSRNRQDQYRLSHRWNHQVCLSDL